MIQITLAIVLHQNAHVQCVAKRNCNRYTKTNDRVTLRRPKTSHPQKQRLLTNYTSISPHKKEIHTEKLLNPQQHERFRTARSTSVRIFTRERRESASVPFPSSRPCSSEQASAKNNRPRFRDEGQGFSRTPAASKERAAISRRNSRFFSGAATATSVIKPRNYPGAAKHEIHCRIALRLSRPRFSFVFRRTVAITRRRLLKKRMFPVADDKGTYRRFTTAKTKEQ